MITLKKNKLWLSQFERSLSMKSMSVSFKKGKSSQSSIKHNNRSDYLDEFNFDKVGHEHIRPEYTHLNENLVEKNIVDVYDEYFEDAVKKYNETQKRKDRKIGKGKALTREEKDEKIKILTAVIAYHNLPKKDQAHFFDRYNANQQVKQILQDAVNAYSGLTGRQLRKKLTEAKHVETLGEAYYKKIKHSPKTRTHVEFVVAFGRAEDYNETNSDGVLVDKNGAIITTTDKAKRTREMVSKSRTDPNGEWQKSKRRLEKWLKDFEKRHPEMAVFNASIHMDEATPHLHLDVVPIGDATKVKKYQRYYKAVKDKNGTVIHKAGSLKHDKNGNLIAVRRKNGVSLNTAFNTVLDNLGYKLDPNDNRKQFADFQKDEQAVMALFLAKDGISRRKGVTNHYKSTLEYKQAQETKEHQQAEIQKNDDILLQQRSSISDTQQQLDEKTKKLGDVTDSLAKKQKEAKDAQVQAIAGYLAYDRYKKEREKREKELEEKEKKLAERENKLNEQQNTIDRKAKDLKSVNRELNKRAKILDERESKLQKLENKFKKVTKSVSKFFKHYYRTVFEDEGFSKSGLDHYSTIYADSPYLAENVSKSFSEHAFKQALPDLKDVTETLGALNVAFNEHNNNKLTREVIKNLNKNINKEDNINNISDNVNTASSVKSEGEARTDNVHDTHEKHVQIHYHDSPESPDDDIFDTF